MKCLGRSSIQGTSRSSRSSSSVCIDFQIIWWICTLVVALRLQISTHTMPRFTFNRYIVRYSIRCSLTHVRMSRSMHGWDDARAYVSMECSMDVCRDVCFCVCLRMDVISHSHAFNYACIWIHMYEIDRPIQDNSKIKIERHACMPIQDQANSS